MRFVILFSVLLVSAHSTSENQQCINRNPNPPPHLSAHIFIFADGQVPVADGSNPFENNALDGRNFLTNIMRFSESDISSLRQNATAYWNDAFGINVQEIMRDGKAMIKEYQISPVVNERAYLITKDCNTPAEGHRVLDGGLQLLITSEGVPGKNPLTGESIVFPSFTNLVFAFLRIKNCGNHDIVLPYKSSSLATFSLNAFTFELKIAEHSNNPFGVGKLLGMSAPTVEDDVITNRLLNYITFPMLDKR